MGARFFRGFSLVSASLSFFLLLGIFIILFLYSKDSMNEFGFGFLFDNIWEVGEDDEGGIFGGLVPIVGTLYATMIAMVVAIPIAMGIAIFLTEVAPAFLIKPVSVAIELLAAIPSIIYGMWGTFLLCSYSSKYIWRLWYGAFDCGIGVGHHGHTFHVSNHKRCHEYYT